MKQRTAAFLTVFFLALAVFSVCAFAETAVVTPEKGVNLRSGPGAEYEVLVTIPYNTAVTVTGSSGSWYAVTYNGMSGYASASYLRFVTEQSGSTAGSAAGSTGSSAGASSPSIFSGSGTVSSSSNTSAGTASMGTVFSGTTSGGTTFSASGTSGTVSSGMVFSGKTSSGETFSGTVTQGITSTGTVSSNAAYSGTATQSTYSAGVASTGTASAGTTYSGTGAYGSTYSTATSSGTSSIGTSTAYSPSIFGSGTTTAGTGSTGTAVNGTASTGTVAVYVTPTPTATPVTVKTVTQRLGYITGDNVQLRSSPSAESESLGNFHIGDSIYITGICGEWVAVTADGKSGYVSGKYVSDGTYTPSTSTSTTTSSSTVSSATQTSSAVTGTSTADTQTASAYTETQTAAISSTLTSAPSYPTVTGQQVADLARTFAGTKYSWGSADPENGFDCSGLVWYCYKQFGIALFRTAAEQATNGVHVEKSELKPGDLLCFYNRYNYVYHVGIYLGSGQFVHAANSEAGVIVSDLAKYSSGASYEARRIIT